MEANYENLLLHTEARWLLRGKALSRVYELKEKMLAFFSLERQGEFYILLCNDSWKSKLAYLVVIFDLLNKTNSNMQGKNENLFIFSRQNENSTRKIESVVGHYEYRKETLTCFFIFRKRITKK